MTDVGHGQPLVLVPGVQGRWEWMRPAVDALAAHFRVLSFTLAGERTSEHRFEPHLGFDNFIVQIDRVLEDRGVTDAVLCGVSYGGLIAVRYAALRPERVRALVLVSALAPGYVPDARTRSYVRSPHLLAPLFVVRAIRRAGVEVAAALPDWTARLRFGARQAWSVVTAPMSPSRMAARMRLLEGVDFEAAARQVTAPALVITGDPALDQVVPVEHTGRYLRLLPQTEQVSLDRTGHLGLVTRPRAFADLVSAFSARAEHQRDPRRTGRMAG